MQIAPVRVKQTLSSKLSALEFGLAARQAKFIRHASFGIFAVAFEFRKGNVLVLDYSGFDFEEGDRTQAEIA